MAGNDFNEEVHYNDLPVTLGDFACTRVEGSFSLAYLVFNTIMNLTSQDAQAWGVKQVPSGVLLDAGGRIRYVNPWGPGLDAKVAYCSSECFADKFLCDHNAAETNCCPGLYCEPYTSNFGWCLPE